MTQKHAHRRYMKLFVPAMAMYMLSILGISFAKKNATMPEPLLYGLAVIPAVFILIWIWGHMRYITELDEYLRGLQVRAVLIGMAAIMAVSTIWGLLEELAAAPAVPIFFIVPGFYFIYGLAYLVIGKRAGVKGGYL